MNLINPKLPSVGILLLALASCRHAALGQQGQTPANIHGSLSATFAQSNEVDYYGDTDGNTDLFLLEGIFNITKPTQSGWLFSGQAYAYELNDFSEITLDFLSASYELSDELNVSIGRNKLAFGLYNDSQDVDVARTVAILPMGVYPSFLRPILASTDGVALSGTFDLGTAGFIDYRSSVGAQQTVLDGAPVIETFSSSTVDWNKWSFDGVGYGIQLAWRPKNSQLRLLLSHYESPESRTDGVLRREPFAGSEVIGSPIDISFQALSIEYFRGKWSFNAEYMRRDLDAILAAPVLEPFGQSPVVQRQYVDSLYASGTYQVTDSISFGAYYNYHDDDRKDITDRQRNRETARDTCLSASWRCSDNALLKLEYHYIEGTATASSTPRGDDNLSSENDTWDLAVLKTTFFF